MGRSEGTGFRLVSYSVNHAPPTSVTTAGVVTALSVDPISSPEYVTANVTAQFLLGVPNGVVTKITPPALPGDNGWYDAGTRVEATYAGAWSVTQGQSRTAALGYSVGGNYTPLQNPGNGSFVVKLTMESPRTIELNTTVQYFVSFRFTDATGSREITPSDLQINLDGQEVDLRQLNAWLGNGTAMVVSRVDFESVDVKPTLQVQRLIGGPETITLSLRVYDVQLKVTDLLGLPATGAHIEMTLSNGTTVSGAAGGDGILIVRGVPLPSYQARVDGYGQTVHFKGDASSQNPRQVPVVFGPATSLLTMGMTAGASVLGVYALLRRGRGR